MISVGITGTLGAGKSTVGRLFADWGAHRIDADALAREAVEPGTDALAAIRDRWGPSVIDEEGRLDRGALREIVFHDASERERLEAIVHPAVGRLRRAAVERAREDGAEISVSEIPLLFEKELADDYDVVIAVHAPEEIRRERVRRDRGMDEETFRAIDATQWPSARKRGSADFVIENAGDRGELEEAAREVWAALRQRV